MTEEEEEEDGVPKVEVAARKGVEGEWTDRQTDR